jgi:hypothetical protein
MALALVFYIPYIVWYVFEYECLKVPVKSSRTKYAKV